ncbi:MAG: pyridoxamine 5-phosphate oxidase [Acidimicrobiaceae bacterium]
MDAADLDPDPIAQFEDWLDAASAELPEPTAMALATAGADGHPRVRHVLLKGIDEDGFVWFTSYESLKGRQLAENPWASIVFPWFPMHRQVIVTGPVERVSAEASDAYFSTRDRESQIGAWASDQSSEIPDKAWLERRVEELEARYAGRPVPRPPFWGGFRLRPDTIEFWQQGANRLHDRIVYRRTSGGWTTARLSP